MAYSYNKVLTMKQNYTTLPVTSSPSFNNQSSPPWFTP